MAQKLAIPDTAFGVSRSKRKRPREHNDAHLKWIRTLPCVLSGRTDGIEAVHIRMSDPRYGKRETGKGEKPDDRWTVPLHHNLHAEQHRLSERVFWGTYKVDPCRVALALYNNTGDDDMARVILQTARNLGQTCAQ